MKKINYLILFFTVLLLTSCKKLEQTIELEFEKEDKELVVECYLEAGKPYRLLLTETKNYFDVINICPFVRKALVIITYNGLKDTLKESSFSGGGCSSIIPYYNTDSTRFFNYGSTQICPSDFNNDFTLEVWDTLNDRYIIATTRFIRPPVISTLQIDWNTDTTQAYCILGCPDDKNTKDYYRMTLHKNSLFTKKGNSLFKYRATKTYINQSMYDQDIFAGQDILQVSGYDFYKTDTVIATIYHIEQAYYDYLTTSKNAIEANINPFVEPSKITSNIEGGQGIFTFLSYDRDSLYIPW